MGGSGEVVEWAVQMRRLPDDATLLARLARGQLEPGVIPDLARRIAAFHAQAAGGPEIARCGRFDVVARNARENFVQSQGHIGHSVSRQVFERLQRATERELAAQRALIETRAEHGIPRDTHGDLRLEHIYLLRDSIAIIDCIEFNEQFRYADPVADIAFLTMELISQGRSDLATRCADAYFAASTDPAGRRLLPFYVAYRAAVRAKVDGMKSLETEVPDEERSAARLRARGYWLRGARRVGFRDPAPLSAARRRTARRRQKYAGQTIGTALQLHGDSLRRGSQTTGRRGRQTSRRKALGARLARACTLPSGTRGPMPSAWHKPNGTCSLEGAC